MSTNGELLLVDRSAYKLSVDRIDLHGDSLGIGKREPDRRFIACVVRQDNIELECLSILLLSRIDHDLASVVYCADTIARYIHQSVAIGVARLQSPVSANIDITIVLPLRSRAKSGQHRVGQIGGNRSERR